MCGLAALALPHEPELLDRLAGALAHRGPDGTGVHRDGQVALVARRLAIVDLPGGAQPMANDDGSLVLAFNGEIFNAPELRAELERDGVRFATDHSDTEVVLRLYERGGEFLPRLNGMFAFVIHDRRNLLFGARDRFGIKPLYYTRPEAGSRARQSCGRSCTCRGVGRELDREPLALPVAAVRAGRAVDPGRDPAPATGARVPLRHDDGQLYDVVLVAARVRAGGAGDWAAALRQTLREAVVRWTLSDVPVAVSLSGGLDSSSVAALLAEAGRPPRTYTLGFASPEDSSLNELPPARALASRWGTEHHELVVDADDLLDDLLQMVWALHEPYGGGLPSWYVFRFMADDVKVGLTGTGGDELFGNYRRFVPFETARLARWRRSFSKYYFEPSYYFRDEEKRALGLDGPSTRELLENVFGQSGSESPRDSVLYLDTHTAAARRVPAHDGSLLDALLVGGADAVPRQRACRAGRTDAAGGANAGGRPEVPAARGGARPASDGASRRAEARVRLPAGAVAARRAAAAGRSPALARASRGAGHLRRELRLPRADLERLWPILMFQLWHLLYVEEALTEAPAFSWRDLSAGSAASPSR